MSTAVVWFRKCLRLHDNPSLAQVCDDASIQHIVPIYILDTAIVGKDFEKLSHNRIRFLFESLVDLDNKIKSISNNSILVFHGAPQDVVRSLSDGFTSELKSFSADYCSEPHGRKVSIEISDFLGKESGTACHFHPATHTILDLEKTVSQPGFKNPKSMKDIEKIFGSTFPKDDQGFFQIPNSLPEPSTFKPSPPGFQNDLLSKDFNSEIYSITSLETKFSELGFLETSEENSYFKGGESEALDRLTRKVSNQTDFVNSFRKPKTASTNLPANALEPSTTGLSPYITIGSLSVRRLWEEVEKANRQGPHSEPPESLHGQLLFREMFYLLSLAVPNWDNDLENSMCKRIDWGETNEPILAQWSEGKTGFPLIDALMRQLDTTGWMHHLGRHAVSCFLTRGQLWQHWKHGRDVFDHKLLDGDWALNNANWLWLSGVAPFSMPYFRLYNPCPDGKSSLNVDAVEANFIRHWVPELKNFPVKYIYEPHLAPLRVQQEAGCIIGQHYPYPMVDRKEVAKKNLAKFKASLAKN